MASQRAEGALRVRMRGSAAIDLAWLGEGTLDTSITPSNARQIGEIVVLATCAATLETLRADPKMSKALAERDRHCMWTGCPDPPR